MKLVILDRDGVMNHDSDAYIKSVDEWIEIPGSAEAVGKLCQAGYTVAVATNQSGLAREYFSQATLDAMHNKMTQLAAQHGGRFAHIAFCPHLPTDGCDCRKPAPGLIRQIEAALNVNAAECGAWMVGDSIKDLEVAVATGCKPALVRTGKGEKSEHTLTSEASEYKALEGTPIFDNLSAFVNWLLQQS